MQPPKGALKGGPGATRGGSFLPDRPVATLDEIAHVIVFMSSDDSAFLTGRLSGCQRRTVHAAIEGGKFMRFQNKIVVIATSGGSIGIECARMLQGEGAKVVFLGLRQV